MNNTNGVSTCLAPLAPRGGEGLGVRGLGSLADRITTNISIFSSVCLDSEKLVAQHAMLRERIAVRMLRDVTSRFSVRLNSLVVDEEIGRFPPSLMGGHRPARLPLTPGPSPPTRGRREPYSCRAKPDVN